MVFELTATKFAIQALAWAGVGAIGIVSLLRYAARRDAQRESRGEYVNRSLATYHRKRQARTAALNAIRAQMG